MNQIYYNQEDEEYFKDRSLMQSDKLEEERNLWQWIEDHSLTENLVKDIAIQGKKSYLYKSEDDLNLNFNLQI